MSDLLKDINNNFNILDICFLIVILYNIVTCSLRGFSLSLISFMKWVLSAVVTIILVPKLQPIVGKYIQSEFINSFGIGIAIFIVTLFVTIVIGKITSKAVTWTGLGLVDKIFGFLFGFLKGYIVSICLFFIFNWFYPYQNWGISAEEAFSFNVINKGSKILINEFPSSDDFLDTKEEIEKI